MNIKSVSSPIGSFDAAYNQLGLHKLSFIGQSQSKYPRDQRLQISIDNFFSEKGLQFVPTMDLQGTEFQLLVWNALCSIPRGSTASTKILREKLVYQEHQELLARHADSIRFLFLFLAIESLKKMDQLENLL